MKSTKIDWCDCTVNPVIGCKNGCEYCYARKINDRFKFVENWNEPKFFPERLKEFKSKKPKSVFIDSMSDIGCWDDEWLAQVLSIIADNPQHYYLALTKTNARKIWSKTVRYEMLNQKAVSHFYLGKSVTNQSQFDTLITNGEIVDFLSVEPLHSPIDFGKNLPKYARTVIIGAETGNRKGKIVPEKQWVQDIVSQCDKAGVAVFMKESLRTLMGDEFRQDKLPWSVE